MFYLIRFQKSVECFALQWNLLSANTFDIWWYCRQTVECNTVIFFFLRILHVLFGLVKQESCDWQKGKKKCKRSL